ncbi:MAG: MFS transporter [bacterium]
MRIRSRFAIVWLLTGLNLFNYLDRYVVNAVSPRIQESFRLTDAQTGWVIGAFMFGYFLTSPIFGALGDRYRRRGLIALGVGIWSLATAGSGMAAGFLSLLLARVIVGVGEASYATLSPTIIDDLSDSRSKTRNLAIFYAAIPLGSALGYVAGGSLEHAFGWRSAFYVAGLPGILLAILVATIDEPPRAAVAAGSGHGSFLGSTATLMAIPAYRYTVLGYVCYTFALGAFAAWAPAYLEARLHLPLQQADHGLGIVLAVTGLLGTAIGGFLGDRWGRSSADLPPEKQAMQRTRAGLAICAIATAVAAPAALVTLLCDRPGTFFVAIGVTELFLFISTAPANTALLGSVPSGLRASAMALCIFAIHLFGDLVSPPAIGRASDAIRSARRVAATVDMSSLKNPALADGGASLRTAMLVLPVMIAAGAALWALGSRAARRAAA